MSLDYETDNEILEPSSCVWERNTWIGLGGENSFSCVHGTVFPVHSHGILPFFNFQNSILPPPDSIDFNSILRYWYLIFVVMSGIVIATMLQRSPFGNSQHEERFIKKNWLKSKTWNIGVWKWKSFTRSRFASHAPAKRKMQFWRNDPSLLLRFFFSVHSPTLSRVRSHYLLVLESPLHSNETDGSESFRVCVPARRLSQRLLSVFLFFSDFCPTSTFAMLRNTQTYRKLIHRIENYNFYGSTPP